MVAVHENEVDVRASESEFVEHGRKELVAVPDVERDVSKSIGAN
jgi:hypothetical protein